LREVEQMLAGEEETRALLDRTPSHSSSSTAEEGRFPAGTVLVGRYRILGLLGRGGMGEVYKAFDLILNQVVALKFLAASHFSEAALMRFRNEVRIARQVSHPNVCRVYDLGMAEGLHFLSMEYIDGEDLASLLRRIGRLPQDKAMEFTRKICAGLAAAHERGVLHRDLKPANIMIDGRGQPRITDFGLAGLAAEIPLSDLRSGTPAYLSPEQKAGKEVTTRSDLYSLGLVLHEMFTGKSRSESGTLTHPSDFVKDLDPAVERLILRCLEEEPRRRPSSAFNVAMALPGADPIAAALAAGETPSPEMVAASQEKEGFSARTAVLCFFAIVVLVVACYFTMTRTQAVTRAAVDRPPDALAFRAEEILKSLGYTEAPARQEYGFTGDQNALMFLNQKPASERDALLAAHRPPVVRFWYRQGRGRLHEVPNRAAPASEEDPPRGEAGSGATRVWLDAKGRLIDLLVPPQPGNGPEAGGFDWAKLLAAAELDEGLLSPAPARQLPATPFDERMAWNGVYPGKGGERIHVEAAAWRGRPVFFAVDGEWGPAQVAPMTGARRGVALLTGSAGVILALGSLVMAYFNLRSGRSDRKGATVTATVVFLARFVGWLLTAEHGSDPLELFVVVPILAMSLLMAAITWVAYVAIEPHIRKRWPDSLISWSRLKAGRLRDPLIASHVLAGLLMAVAADFAIGIANLAAGAPLYLGNVEALSNNAAFSAEVCTAVVAAVLVGLQYLLTIMLLRMLLKRVWLADAIASLLLAATGGVDYSDPIRFMVTYPVVVLFVYGVLWLMKRFGLVAMMADWFMNAILFIIPPSLTAWYTGRVVVAAAIPIAMAAWALWVVLTDKRAGGLSTETAG
jgi:serine/threonine-protein kinase